ncbi:MAG: M20 family metallopeptidase [Pyrinomonadaceae bacterium]
MTLPKEQLKALREYFAAQQDNLLAFTRALVETESPSGDEAGSRDVVSLLVDQAKTIAAVNSVERIAVPGFGEHVRINAFADGNQERPIVLLGHTDTVHPRGSIKERPWRTDENRVYGPGIFDMKSSCALALELLRGFEATNTRPSRPITLLFMCDEESGSVHGRSVVEAEARKAHAVLVLEPSAGGGRVKTGRKGTGMFTIEVHGRAAHAGLDPEKGVNAVLELARQTVRLHELNDPANGTNVTVTILNGGTASNVVPALATAEVDMRFTSVDLGVAVEGDVLNLKPFDARAQIVVTGGINRPPLERTPKVAELYELARGIAAKLDFELGETSVGGGSDGNFVGALGVAVLDGLGIEGDGAHAAHEHIIVDNIATRGAMLAGLIASL